VYDSPVQVNGDDCRCWAVWRRHLVKDSSTASVMIRDMGVSSLAQTW